MRLSNDEIQHIITTAKQYFGNTVSVILFGSRTNDQLKGGDIDLLICPKTGNQKKSFLQEKIKFLVALKKNIGDQKIDVVIEKRKDNRSIILTAKSRGVRLC